MNDPITQAVVVAFHTPGVALLLAGVILLAGLALVATTSIGGYRPLVHDLIQRLNLLHEVRGPQTRQAFYARLDDIDARFGAGASDPAVINGWTHYRSQLVETDGGVCGSFMEASEAFGRLDESARTLEWWANIFVAIGLVVTFLGIVAALTEATQSIGAAGATGAAAQASLLGLLSIAATKFWTSIGGVLTSIILRVVARSRRRRIERLEEDLFAALDSSVDLLSPSRVMVDQLRALSRIEEALTHGAATPGASSAPARTTQLA